MTQVTANYENALNGPTTREERRMAKIEEQLWVITLTYQDVHDCYSTLTTHEFDVLPLPALDRVIVRAGISRDRVRAVTVEAGKMTRGRIIE